MSPSLQRIKELFAEAAPMGPDARVEFLARACGDDAPLLADVLALLDAHDRSAGRFREPKISAWAASGGEGPGTRIGQYKLLELIGEGGFGAVFMAEQEEPIRRRVAIKVLKLGMDSRQVIARFEAERQALALMDHPNIARVFDAGATATGRPYFVMELVRGVPITQYCDQVHLSTAERLAVFAPVCRAIQHAHQKGIIHRDLKPSNVLVTLHDGNPVPKVIDFGIAKATDQRLTDKTLFTGFGQLLGTPAYMSPEQAEMSGLDVDTRSDVYSLGVLLYELLAGAPPFELARLQSAGIAEVLRIIREVEPPKPSTRVSTLGDVLASVAALRATEPRKLGALLRGDLDWIVMMALAKDRRRRYDSASALALDVERYLAHEPVLARPPSVAYRWSKFVQRNRTAVLAGAIVVLALVGGLTGTLVELFRARASANEATANAEDARRKFAVAREGADFLLNDVVRGLWRIPGSRELQRHILDAALEHYDRLAALKPGDSREQRRIWIAFQELGDAYLALGKSDEARAAFARFRDLVVPVAAANPSNRGFQNDRAVSFERDGMLAFAAGRIDEASSAFSSERELLTRLADGAPDNREQQDALALCYGWLERVASLVGDADAGPNWNQKARTILEATSAKTPKDAAELHQLASALLRASDTSPDPRALLDRAAKLEREVVELDGDAPNYMVLRGSIDLQRARIDLLDRKYSDARSLALGVKENRERLSFAEPNNPNYQLDLLEALECAGNCALLSGEISESHECTAKANALATHLRESGGESIEFSLELERFAERLGDLAERAGEIPAARQALEQADILSEKMLGLIPNNRAQLTGALAIKLRLGGLVEQMGEFQRAGTYLQKADQLSNRAVELGPDDLHTQLLRQATLVALADHARVLGDFDASEVHCADALTLAERLAGDHPGNAGCAEALSCALERQGDVEVRRIHLREATAIRRRAVEVRGGLLAADPSNVVNRYDHATSIFKLADALDMTGVHAEARTRMVEARETFRALIALEPSNARIGSQAAYTMLRIGEMLDRDGDLDGAIGQYRLMCDTLAPIVAQQPAVATYRTSLMDGFDHLAAAYWHEHDEAGAREWAAKGLEGRESLANAAGTNFDALNNCAWALLSCYPEDLRDPKRALEYASKAVQLTGEHDPSCLDTCALAYFECGQPERAVETQTRALAMLGAEDSARRAKFQARLDQYQAGKK